MIPAQNQILEDVFRLLEAPGVPSTRKYYDNRWTALDNALADDLLQVTDWLSDLDPAQWKALLERAKPAAGAGLLGKDNLADWVQDCQAAAWAQLYGFLSQLSIRDRRVLLAGGGDDPLWEALHAVLSRLVAVSRAAAEADVSEGSRLSQDVHQNRLSSRAAEMLAGRLAMWIHTESEIPLPEEEAHLLAGALVELEEEFAWRRIWGVTAGAGGGVAQIEVAGFRVVDKHLPRCELALWSRHLPSLADWHGLEGILERIDTWLPGMESVGFRIAFNPPNRVPAGPQHITAQALEGGSLGLALALAAYSMQQGMRLYELAATGQVDGKQIKPVEGVAEKVSRLLAYNAEVGSRGRQPVTHLLVPDNNLAEAQAANELYGQVGARLRINEGLRGERIAVRKVGDLLQPGVLRDGLEPFCEWLLESAVLTRPLAGKDEEDLLHARPLIEAALDGLSASQKGHIVPMPYRDPGDIAVTRAAVRLLARECAARRLDWVRSWEAGQATLETRPGAPIMVLEDLPEHPPEDFESQAVKAVLQAPVCLTEADIREGWRSLGNEFTLILRGKDDLISKHITGDLGLLAQIDGLGAKEGRQSVLFVASGVHQMLEWAEGLGITNQAE